MLAGSFKIVDSTSVTTNYADGSSFTGNLVSDAVCITANPASCAQNIQWYQVKSETNVPSSYDGIAGLSKLSDTTVPPIVQQFYTGGLISEQKFSLSLTGRGTSYLDFGPIDKT